MDADQCDVSDVAVNETVAFVQESAETIFKGNKELDEEADVSADIWGSTKWRVVSGGLCVMRNEHVGKLFSLDDHMYSFYTL